MHTHPPEVHPAPARFVRITLGYHYSNEQQSAECNRDGVARRRGWLRHQTDGADRHEHDPACGDPARGATPLVETGGGHEADGIAF